MRLLYCSAFDDWCRVCAAVGDRDGGAEGEGACTGKGGALAKRASF